MPQPIPDLLNTYKHYLDMSTRWMDNDIYQHINNVVYYSFFDTVVNHFLLENDLLSIGNSKTIGLVVETKCNYFQPISFPDKIRAGLRVKHVGNTSVNYEIGLFRNSSEEASAQGHFIHVYVDNITRKPV